MSAYVDFADVKSKVSIEQGLTKLGITLPKAGAQLRGQCPMCDSKNERGFVVTPSKGLWYCFSEQKGGDVIALTAAVKEIELREAALWLIGTVNSQRSTVQSTVNSSSNSRANSPSQPGMAELDYLVPEHEAVAAVGFDEATAKALGIGYANRGIMRGTVAVPIRLPDGSLVGYIGIIEARLPTRFHIPGSNVVKLKTA